MTHSPPRSSKQKEKSKPKPSSREELEAELTAIKSGSSKGKKKRSSASSSAKNRGLDGRKAAETAKKANGRYTVACVSSSLVVARMRLNIS